MCVTPFYEDYLEYGGKLSPEEFAAVFREASYTVSALTFSRSENPPEIMRKRVRDCVCEIVDLLHSYKKAAAAIPSGINSISNAGYSVTRGAGSDASAEINKSKDCEAICRKYLLSPVNLMYSGVC